MSIMTTVRETGYDGWVSGEFMPLPDAETGARRGLKHMRSVLGRVG
jgi:sugar phosphate isomerase/epimerase